VGLGVAGDFDERGSADQLFHGIEDFHEDLPYLSFLKKLQGIIAASSAHTDKNTAERRRMDFCVKKTGFLAAVLVTAALLGGFAPVFGEQSPSHGVQGGRISLSEEETELLIRTVSAAAGGSMRIDEQKGKDSRKTAASYAARVGIIATVLNRLEDPRFPASVPLIIISDRTFPDTASAEEIPQWDRLLTQAALEAALMGFDPTNGALYFSTPTEKVNRFSVTCEMEGYSFGVPEE
jgi:hypothetical protein